MSDCGESRHDGVKNNFYIIKLFSEVTFTKRLEECSHKDRDMLKFMHKTQTCTYTCKDMHFKITCASN